MRAINYMLQVSIVSHRQNMSVNQTQHKEANLASCMITEIILFWYALLMPIISHHIFYFLYYPSSYLFSYLFTIFPIILHLPPIFLPILPFFLSYHLLYSFFYTLPLSFFQLSFFPSFPYPFCYDITILFLKVNSNHDNRIALSCMMIILTYHDMLCIWYNGYIYREMLIRC